MEPNGSMSRSERPSFGGVFGGKELGRKIKQLEYDIEQVDGETVDSGRRWQNFQSITEVLQDPDSGNPPVSDISLAGGPKTPNFGPEISMQSFEPYLMLFTPRYEEYKSLEAYATVKGRDLKNPLPQSTPQPLQEDISSIPRSYFEEKYSLSMSQELFEAQDRDHKFSSPEAVRLTREKIDGYLSVVERQLYERVLERKKVLEDAMAKVDSLRELIEQGCQAASLLRSRVGSVVSSWEEGALQLSSLYKRRANMQKLLDALSRGSDGRASPQLVELLLRGSDYASAMDACNAAQLALVSEHLREAKAFQPARERIAEAAKRVDEGLLADFETVVKEIETFEGEDFEDTICPIVSSVVKLKRLPRLLNWVKENREAKFKQIVEDTSDPVEAMQLMKNAIKTASKVFETLPKEQVVVQYAETICGDAQARAAELVRSSLYGVRSLINDDAKGLEKAASILTAGLNFNSESESLLGVRRGRFSYLRAAASERVAAYTSTLYRVHFERLTKQLKAERWVEVKVPKEIQLMILDLRESATSSSASALSAAKRKDSKKPKREYDFVSLDDDDEYDVEEELGRGELARMGSNEKQRSDMEKLRMLAATALDDSETAEHLYVGSEKFKVVESAMEMVRSSVMFASVTRVLPFGEELGRRVVELVRTFHELTSKQVLGAQALNTAGLRGISARHLALASQSIAMAHALLPLLSKSIKDHLQPAVRPIFEQGVASLSADLLKHQHQMLDKIYMVMMERFEFQKAVLLRLPWQSEAKLREEPNPSGYMESLMKETNVLHRILLNILSRKQLFDVYTRLGSAFGSKLIDTYATLDTSNDWVRRRIASDVSYLRLKLLAMEAVISTSDVHTMESVEELYAQHCPDRAQASKQSTVSAVAKKTEKGIRAEETIEHFTTDPVVEETEELSTTEENVGLKVQETPPDEPQPTPGSTSLDEDVPEETEDVPNETGPSWSQATNSEGKDSSGPMEALQGNPPRSESKPGERFLEDELNAGEPEPRNPEKST
ncbi:hypothetical protein NDN08_002185 [Rhodosorus marinus]|uniref:Vacuolar protein sorting-associated protein 54 n=1 Tax=Rhodosorus marinus TaxID=101924 RepID=A0AAV8UUF1_9RHOD|nr:hypothetical protein NDN08_002185 [Rhodosorus marinus]